MEQEAQFEDAELPVVRALRHGPREATSGPKDQRELSFASSGESSPLQAGRVLLLPVQEASAVWPLVPFAVLEIVLARRPVHLKRSSML
jgi:hypothetical protein